jgi:hypothetical protein
MAQNSVAVVGSIFAARDMTGELKRKSIRKIHLNAIKRLKTRLHVHCTCSMSLLKRKSPVFLFSGDLEVLIPINESGRSYPDTHRYRSYVILYHHTECFILITTKKVANIFIDKDSKK